MPASKQESVKIRRPQTTRWLLFTGVLSVQLFGSIRKDDPHVAIKTMSVDIELALIDASTLQRQVIPAVADFVERGDSAPAKELVEATMASPQFRAALVSDKIIVEHFVQESRKLLEGKLPKAVLDYRHGGHLLTD